MVYVFLCDGFEEIEAITPIDLMRRAGITVKTVGIGKKSALGVHGIEVKTDIELTDVCLDNAQMLVLPGGAGHVILSENKGVTDLILEADRREIPLATICASPSILGALSLLNGKRGTCFTGFESKCTGMTYTGERVETDGRIITSRGAGTALDFALAIIEMLCGKAKADEIKSAILA